MEESSPNPNKDVDVETGNGMVNPAFEDDGKKSPTASGGSSTDDSAVNLELVDMTQTKAQLAEADKVDSADKAEKGENGAFGEYFVPVNEHKKGIRGEKLYVTKDSRERKGCGKRFCGALALFLLIAAVVVAVLVGGMCIKTFVKFQFQ